MKAKKKKQRLEARIKAWEGMSYGNETAKDKTGPNAKGTWHHKPGSLNK